MGMSLIYRLFTWKSLMQEVIQVYEIRQFHKRIYLVKLTFVRVQVYTQQKGWNLKGIMVYDMADGASMIQKLEKRHLRTELYKY